MSLTRQVDDRAFTNPTIVVTASDYQAQKIYLAVSKGSREQARPARRPRLLPQRNIHGQPPARVGPARTPMR
ncbi:MULTISPECIES: hypothetical protein [unclassified Frankia]|uniref:hypothetical protein n=1 Tax=unclassified Frankia TaxID=2632575 RepID=UPI002AD29DDE|nr:MULTISPECIES: hypothetical protein [unclassified Frankia]